MSLVLAYRTCMLAHFWGWVSMRNTFPDIWGYSLCWDEMEPGVQGKFQNTFLHVIGINCVFKHRGIANFR